MQTRSQTAQSASIPSSTSKPTPTSSPSLALESSIGVPSVIENDNCSSSKTTVVSWLQLLLDPIVGRRSVGDASSGLKHVVTLDDEVSSSAPPVLLSKAGNALGDQIRLLISYADCTLTWTFYFCWLDTSIPPDMDFGDNHFLPPYETYKEFYDWDPTAADCFLNLFDRLFLEYRKAQSALCEKKNRLSLELNDLRAHGFDDDKFDVYTYQDGARRGDVVFIFPIRVAAVAELPAKFVSKQSADGCAQLKIKLTSFGEGKAHADLEMTPFLNKLFNGRSLKLPPMQCFVWEYVEAVRGILDEEVACITDAFKFKRDLMSTLIASYPKNSLIDFNGSEFTAASFLLDNQDFKYVLKVTLSPKFPTGNNAIQVAFSSIYHEAKEIRILARKQPRQPMATVVNLPSTIIRPRMAVEELVDKIRDFVELHVGEFKKKSCQQGV